MQGIVVWQAKEWSLKYVQIHETGDYVILCGKGELKELICLALPMPLCSEWGHVAILSQTNWKNDYIHKNLNTVARGKI